VDSGSSSPEGIHKVNTVALAVNNRYIYGEEAMPKEVRMTPAALAELESLQEPILSRVNRAVERLKDWPAVSGAKPLRARLKGYYRLRVGDWRIIFRATEEAVIVTRIANRRDVYEE
jgi:mRNA interferase RelE/StbE